MNRYVYTGSGPNASDTKYELLGIAKGAGTSKLEQSLHVYRDPVSCQLYYRTADDFAEKMEEVDGHVALESEHAMIMRQALEHIQTTAEASRTGTRRLNWIAVRAKNALAGKHYSRDDCELPPTHTSFRELEFNLKAAKARIAELEAKYEVEKEA